MDQKTILIAEDSDSVRKAVREYLQVHLNVKILEATNGLKAIQLAEKTRPDLVLLDLVMPELSGIETAAVLKRSVPGVPIILFTMHEEEVRVALAKVVGIDAVLYKADGVKKLGETIKALLENPPAPEKPNVTMPGIVEKIIDPPHEGAPEKAQISLDRADDLYREIRIENALTDEKGEQVRLKKGAHVEVTVEAERTDTAPLKADRQ